MGKKIVMAVSGLVMILFLIFHVVGNFALFRGPEAINGYSAFLHGLPGLLWLVRIVLLLSVLVHMLAAAQLMAISRAARTVRYARVLPQAATVASLSMRLSGILIAAFIFFHILHFTTGSIQPAPFAVGNPYANITQNFRIPWVAGLYITAMIFIGLHLHQGAFGWFRTLGLRRRGRRPLYRPIAVVVAVFVWLGFTIVPVAVLLNRVR